jgi:exodeoxyribonuclease VII large subunit
MDLDELLGSDNEEAREQVFSVVQISGRIKTVLESQFRRISVAGEVTGFKPAMSGHVYFSLAEKDAKGVTQKLDCVIYRFAGASRGAPVLKDGDRVVATGRITAWGGASKYQMSVDSIRQAGAGNLLKRLEELRKRLLVEGLFDQERKRPIPAFPRRIGVVTSVRGAAVRDIARTILNRWPADILVVDTLVQGDGAPEGIARGIEMLNRIDSIDVIIVGRGGGSLEDLWAFNEEVTVRAVAASNKPVISAVGHEIDHVLTDDVADARAATPTAAGQMAVQSMADVTYLIDDSAARMRTAVERRIDEYAQMLDDAVESLALASRRFIDLRERSLDTRRVRLVAAHPARRLDDKAKHLETAGLRLRSAGRRLLERPEARLERLRLRIESYNPATPLERGFAIATTVDGRVVRSASDVTPGDMVDVRLGKGAMDCSVVATRPDERG